MRPSDGRRQRYDTHPVRRVSSGSGPGPGSGDIVTVDDDELAIRTADDKLITSLTVHNLVFAAPRARVRWPRRAVCRHACPRAERAHLVDRRLPARRRAPRAGRRTESGLPAHRRQRALDRLGPPRSRSLSRPHESVPTASRSGVSSPRGWARASAICSCWLPCKCRVRIANLRRATPVMQESPTRLPASMKRRHERLRFGRPLMYTQWSTPLLVLEFLAE